MAASYVHIKSKQLPPADDTSLDCVFEDMYAKYFDIISNFCYELIKDQEEAHDIAAEAFIKLHYKLNSLESEDNIRAFLYVVSRNACMDYFRMQKKKQALWLEIKRSQGTEEYLCINSKLDLLYQQAMLDAFEQLPERQKEVISKTFNEQKNSQTIAQEMGVQVRTVYVLRLRAVSFIKEYLRRTVTEGIILLLVISFIC